LALEAAISQLDPLKASNNSVIIGLALVGLQLASYLLQSFAEGTKRRVAQGTASLLTNAIFQKSFDISLEARVQFSSGNILNMMNNDIQELSEFLMPLTSLWSVPLRLIVGIFYLVTRLGASVFAGLGMVVFSLLLTIGSGPLLGKYFPVALKYGDDRVSKIRQALMGMKIIKYRAMEDYFVKGIMESRTLFVATIRKVLYVLAFTQAISQMIPATLPVIIFMVYVAGGGDLDPTFIFSAIYLMDRIREPLMEASFLIQMIAMISTSWKRVTSFLSADVLDPLQVVQEIDSKNSNDGFAIKFKDAHFSYAVKDNDGNEKQDQFKLTVDNLEISRGEFVAVAGSVGSGKTSLLQSLLKQMKLISGTASICGSVAYCSQTPWIFSGTIEDNIKFYTEQRSVTLHDAIVAAGLEQDIDNLPNGLKTVLGEDGVNLSGGQKSRLALARALFRDADVYLLDDPLASLDARVGGAVFRNAIKTALKGKTILLVTHQLQFVSEADRVVVIEGGKIAEDGTYPELIERAGVFAGLMEHYHVSEPETEVLEVEEARTSTKEATDHVNDITEEEERAEGKVKKIVYTRYFKLMGMIYSALICTTFVGGIILSVWSLLFLRDATVYSDGTSSFILVYALLGLGISTFIITQYFALLFGCFEASITLHDNALRSIFNAPMQFFDSNPIGRIINRMSGDVKSADLEILNATVSGIFSLQALVISFIVMLQGTLWIAIILVVVGVVSYYLFDYYQKSNLEMKRLLALTNSPLNAHVTEALSGMPIIVAYGLQAKLQQKYGYLSDTHLGVKFIRQCMAVWIQFRMGILSILLTIGLYGAGLALISFYPNDRLIAAAIGLSLSTAFSFAQQIFYTLLAWGRFESEVF
jgi:ABC-type multidrug transport system fused ATPase/permease subunit